MKTLKRFLFLLLCLCLLSISAIAVWYVVETHSEKLQKEKLSPVTDCIELYDEKDKKIELASNVAWGDLTIEEIPLSVRHAFIDAEDKRFYSHHGFDYLRIAKATLENIKSRSFKQGASTISQQLVKNTHLSQEKTLRRKMKEYKLTKQLEKQYSKEEILCKYLSSIYFGHNCFGLRSAAAFYFDKSLSELTLSDGALLAGLVRSPNNYSPFRNAENCQKRKNTVLFLMYKQGHITKEEKEAAANEPLPTRQEKSEREKSYFNRVFEELESLSSEKAFRMGGKIRIRTYYDADLQEQLSLLKENSVDSAFAVADNKTGGMRAYFSTVGAIARPTGSTLKPLLVYAPALEEGILSPLSPLLDERTDFGGYSPKNYNDKYYGYVSAREALSKSLNVPAVKVLSALGVDNAVKYAEALSLHVPKEDKSLALALGGMKNGFTLSDLLSAYTVFPSNGEFTPCAFIKEIFVNDVSVYKREIKKKRVFSEETAYLTTDMLKTAVDSGTSKKLKSLPFSVAAKTGTNGNANGNTDAYHFSYTSDYTVGVWLGNADNSLTAFTGGGRCADIAYNIHEYLAKKSLPQDFLAPQGVVQAQIDKIEYSTTHNIILADENAPVQYKITELFNRKFLPKTQDTKFSIPFITSPSVSFEGKTVMIDLTSLPTFYEYRIDRDDSTTHNTIYQGKWVQSICDEEIKADKTYRYSVTVYYKDKQGNTVTLPFISTKQGVLVTPQQPPSITEKDWWNE